MSDIFVILNALLLNLLGIVGIGLVCIAIMKFKKYFARKIEDEPFLEEIKKSNKIVEVLASARGSLNADRYSIYLFHNGSHYINGDSVLKVTCSHTSVKSGISQDCPLENTLISSVPELTKPLINYKRGASHVIEIKPSMGAFGLYRSMLDNQGVDVEFLIPIFDNKTSTVIGLSSIQYLNSRGPITGEEENSFFESVSNLELILLNTKEDQPKSKFNSILRSLF